MLSLTPSLFSIPSFISLTLTLTLVQPSSYSFPSRPNPKFIVRTYPIQNTF